MSETPETPETPPTPPDTGTPSPVEATATDAQAAPPAGGGTPVRRRRPPVARWGTASALYTVVVLAVLVVANALGAQVHARFDLTPNHQFTLSKATLKVLHEVRAPIEMYGFLQSGSAAGDQLTTLLHEYQAAGGGKVKTDIVDPASHPGLAQQFGVTEYNDVVVVSGNNHATASAADMYNYSPTGQQQFNGEQAITNAILRVANPQHLPVYFLQGDGEQQLSQNYTTVNQALADGGYTVHTLNLIQQPAVPAGAAAVVVAGPTHDLATAEVQALQKYVRGGGHLFVLLDPVQGAALPNLLGFLNGLGVTARNDIVIDPAAQHHFQSDPAALVPTIESQTITQPMLADKLAVLLPGSVSLLPAAGVKGYSVTPLLKTSSSAYAKTNLKATTTAFDPAQDIRGPFDVGVAITSTRKGDGFRGVVLGSASFALDNAITIQGNRDLFLNSIAWLTGRSQGILIQPVAGLQNQVFLTAGTMRGLFYSYVLLLPALCMVGALVVWSWRRRL